MVLYPSETLPDGSTVVGDADHPETLVVLKPGQWEQIDGLPESEQRHRLREFLAMNKAAPDPRDELTRTIAENESQGQGERHEMQEEAQ